MKLHNCFECRHLIRQKNLDGVYYCGNGVDGEFIRIPHPSDHAYCDGFEEGDT